MSYLKTENERLRNRVAELASAVAAAERLSAENETLRNRVASLEQLTTDVYLQLEGTHL